MKTENSKLRSYKMFDDDYYDEGMNYDDDEFFSGIL